MPGYHDVYVLSPDRSLAAARRFLDRFLPRRREVADDYPVPRFADPPDATFTTAEALIAWIEDHPEEPYALYWANEAPGEPRFAMIFPTADGQAVYGLSVEDKAQEALAALEAHLGSAVGYVDFENPPSDRAEDFERVASDLRASPPRAGPDPKSR